MKLQLYRYLGEKNKIDKSRDLIQVGTCYGSFKGETSVLNPSLLLSLPLEGTSLVTDEDGNLIDDIIVYDGSKDEILNFNYFYIKEFRRYYFVSSIVISNNTILIVSGEVDPLYSFKAQILNNYAMIERNEFTYDAMQEDNLIPLEIEKDTSETTPSAGADVNTTFKADFTSDPNALNIAVTSALSSGYDQSASSPGANLPTIATTDFTDAAGSVCYACDNSNAAALCFDLLTEHSSLATFFKSLVAFPFDLKGEAAAAALNFSVFKYDAGTDTYTDTNLSGTGHYLPTMSKYRIVADFSLPSPSSYLDFNPYTHYEIYLPFYGFYELPYNSIAGDSLLVYYSVDYTSGSAEVYIYDKTQERIIFSAPCQIGIPLSLSSSNAEELQAAKNAAQLNLILGLIGSGVGVMGSAISGNALGLIGAGLTGVQAITGYINQTAQMFERAQSTHNGSAGALYAPLAVRLKVTACQIHSGLDMSKFAHQYGRPLRDVRKLSTLSGFTQVSKVHLEGCDATEGEKAQIESSLLAGVIL